MNTTPVSTTANRIASDSHIRDYVGRLEPMLHRLTRPMQHPLDVVSTRGDVASTVPHLKWDTVDVTSPRHPPTQPCVDIESTQFAAGLMEPRLIIGPNRCCVAPRRPNGRLKKTPGDIAPASASLHQGCSMQPWMKPTQYRPGSTQGRPGSMQRRLWST